MPFHAKQKHLVTQGDINLLLQEQDFNFDIICKYFTGAKDNRYGDLQSLRPVSYAPISLPDKYQIETVNGFVNITLNDFFLISAISDFAQNCPKITVSTCEPLSSEYRLFVFNIFIREIWQIPQSFALTETSNLSSFDSFNVRRLCVMAFYLILQTTHLKEKNSQNSESLQKLYDTFSSELYNILTAGVLKETSDLLKALTLCAIKLSVNIPAFREA